MKKVNKVIVGLSGGVDSTVSAYLLKKQGYYVEALYMKNWEENNVNSLCSYKDDLIYVKKICNILNIKLHLVNFSYEYWNKVFKKFLNEYKKGNTPNPDILCNKEIKFKVFLDFSIKVLNADFIATGHYVRLKIIDKKNYLLKGIDNKKDQSYFLYAIDNKKLSKCLFPIGNLKKKYVISLANKLNFPNACKKNSTGICFIGKTNFQKFLNNYLPLYYGNIISLDTNKVIGKHKGVYYYTIGQRKGLNIGGIKNNEQKPWYVADKNLKKNILYVVQNKSHPFLLSKGLMIDNVNWLFKPKLKSFNCFIKIRYRQIDIPCKIFLLKKNIKVFFDIPLFSIAIGQSAVFYLDELCLGGGIIKKIFK